MRSPDRKGQKIRRERKLAGCTLIIVDVAKLFPNMGNPYILRHYRGDDPAGQFCAQISILD